VLLVQQFDERLGLRQGSRNRSREGAHLGQFLGLFGGQLLWTREDQPDDAANRKRFL